MGNVIQSESGFFAKVALPPTGGWKDRKRQRLALEDRLAREGQVQWLVSGGQVSVLIGPASSEEEATAVADRVAIIAAGDKARVQTTFPLDRYLDLVQEFRLAI